MISEDGGAKSFRKAVRRDFFEGYFLWKHALASNLLFQVMIFNINMFGLWPGVVGVGGSDGTTVVDVEWRGDAKVEVNHV